jgi:SAM-dependent methyltransferase
MKEWLLKDLVCPDCLPGEHLLKLEEVEKKHGDDILEAALRCPRCGQNHPIAEGIAMVLPQASRMLAVQPTGYNSREMLSSYLWSHFCDMMKDPRATDAYQVWSSYFRPSTGTALDIGCSVGRISLELTRTHRRVVGVDTSRTFIQAARTLATQGCLSFDLMVEGHLSAPRTVTWDPGWHRDQVEFLVADAMALPFRADAFQTTTTINVLEKVPSPLDHLKEINRVTAPSDAMVVFSDPFSWDEKFSPPGAWLGGTDRGPYAGRGPEVVAGILAGDHGIFSPPPPSPWRPGIR